MKITPTPFVLLGLCLVLAGPAAAEKADRQKKLVMEADYCLDDELKQVRVCTGNVSIVQGTLILRGARMETREDAQGYLSGSILSDANQMPFYRQKREGLDEYVEAQAQTIEFDGKSDTVKLIQKAQMRRLRGGTLTEEVLGAVITYNNLTDQTTIDGQSAGTATARPGAPGRVRLVRVPSGAASEVKSALPLRASSAVSGATQ